MQYGLGVDLGTTFTGVAVGHSSHAEMISLGDRAVVTPAVVFARSDGRIVTGDAAVRRSLDDPDRVGREFKRRLGDPTPILLGGTPYSPAALMATVLNAAVEKATEIHGTGPEQVVLTHPAVWGPYRREQFDEVARLSGVESVRMVPEPVAAATHYTTTRDLSEGDTVAVYDLGGGTFDTTVIRVLKGEMQVLGIPEGVEWLGGIDFDEAILSHVDRALGGTVSSLDPRDPRSAAALIRLRQDCVAAKEALSVDDETTISTFPLGAQTGVRLTRWEFEDMIRPSLESTIEALHRALQSAEIEAGDLSAVLLVGGSSRIPLVSWMVETALNRPTMVNTHPKHAVALGAAEIAVRAMTPSAPVRSRRPHASRPATARNPTPSPASGFFPPAALSPAVGAPSFGSAAISEAGNENRWTLIQLAVLVLAAVVVLVLAVAAVTNYGRNVTSSSSELAAPALGGATTPSQTGVPGNVSASSASPVLRGTIRSLGDRPQGIAVSPDGRRAYVPSVVSNTIAVIDVEKGTTVQTIKTKAPPQYTAISPDGSRLYVTLIDPTAATNSLQVIDTATNRIVGEIPLGAEPYSPAVSPDGKTILVPDRQSSQLWVLQTASGRVVEKIGVPGIPRWVAFAPNGTRAYVTNFNREQVWTVDLSRNKVVAKARVGVTPIGVAVSPDGRRVAVANYDSRSLSLIDSRTQKALATVAVGKNPQSVAFAPDGRHIYVVNEASNSLSVVDARAGKVTSTLPVGREPWVVEVSADGRHVFVTNAQDDSLSVFTATR